MYIIRGRARGLITYKPKRPIVNISIVVNNPTSAQPSSGADIDIEQSGSGMSVVKNKLSQIKLHANGKTKFNKFISLDL